MSSAAGLTATVDCYCLDARRNARRITRLYEERLRPHGLRATQFSILAALALKGPTPVGELAESLGLERTTLTRNVALLDRKGWVRGIRPQDARKHLLEVTPAGRAKLLSGLSAWEAAQEAAGRERAPTPHVRRTGRDGLASIPARYPGRLAVDPAAWEIACWRRLRPLGAPPTMEQTAA